MSSVTPMRLVPVIDKSTDFTKTFPTVSESQFSIKKQNSATNLTNLDSELLDILHNKDLTDDAKAKLYWIALHKAEVYKDKTMWSEPTIVELRENRFIPIPLTRSLNLNGSPSLKRKSQIDESEVVEQSKRPRVSEEVTEIAQPMSQTSQISRKRKSPNEESDIQLKRMALVNRIQNGHITPQEIENQENIIDSDNLPTPTNENEAISGPLVVVNQQDEIPQPSTSTFNYQPSKFTISDNFEKQLQPAWLKEFYEKLESFPAIHQTKIESLIKKILEKDPKFKVDRNSVNTSQNITIRGDPVQLFLGLVRGRTSRNISLLRNYLQNLQIDFQFGSGLKIKKWVKL